MSENHVRERNIKIEIKESELENALKELSQEIQKYSHFEEVKFLIGYEYVYYLGNATDHTRRDDTRIVSYFYKNKTINVDEIYPYGAEIKQINRFKLAAWVFGYCFLFSFTI